MVTHRCAETTVHFQHSEFVKACQVCLQGQTIIHHKLTCGRRTNLGPMSVIHDLRCSSLRQFNGSQFCTLLLTRVIPRKHLLKWQHFHFEALCHVATVNNLSKGHKNRNLNKLCVQQGRSVSPRACRFHCSLFLSQEKKKPTYWFVFGRLERNTWRKASLRWRGQRYSESRRAVHFGIYSGITLCTLLQWGELRKTIGGTNL